MINLGDKVTDPVTGFTGIAVGRTEWLHGCSRIAVQPKGVDKDGKPIESQTFDEPQLKVLIRHAIKSGDRDTGGPIPNQKRDTRVAARR